MVRQMRGVAYVLLVSSAAACASGPAGARVDPPLAPVFSDPPAQACAKRVAHVVRHEKTTTVAACQVAPIDLASDVTAVIARGADGRVDVHVRKDDEAAQNLPETPSLAGRSYVLRIDGGTLMAPSGDDAGADAEEMARAVALGSLALKWSSDVRRGLRDVVGLRVHGAAPETTITVQPGSGPRYGVRMDATQSDAGMCHTWTTTAHLEGDLTLRDDGTIESVHLSGPETTTQALCPEGARQSGASAAPKECTRGEITLSIDTSCAHP
jgi:hypothetical protein